MHPTKNSFCIHWWVKINKNYFTLLYDLICKLFRTNAKQENCIVFLQSPGISPTTTPLQCNLSAKMWYTTSPKVTVLHRCKMVVPKTTSPREPLLQNELPATMWPWNFAKLGMAKFKIIYGLSDWLVRWFSMFCQHSFRAKLLFSDLGDTQQTVSRSLWYKQDLTETVPRVVGITGIY